MIPKYAGLAGIDFRGKDRVEICLLITVSVCSVGWQGYGLGRLSW